MNKLTTRGLAASALLLVAGAAFAQHANVPGTSPDGAGKDAQSMLNSVGISSNVNTDQVTGRIFKAHDPNQKVSITNLFSVAAYADAHKVGYYQPTGVASDPTWVLGGKDTNLPKNSVEKTITGNFALALKSPEGLFRSEVALNGDNFEHFAVMKLKYASNGYIPHSYVVLMEDLDHGGDKDYNDRAIVICNVDLVPVPEPASMIVLGGGIAAAVARRRRRSNK